MNTSKTTAHDELTMNILQDKMSVETSGVGVQLTFEDGTTFWFSARLAAVVRRAIRDCERHVKKRQLF